MKQTDFEQQHQATWQAFTQNVQALRQGESKPQTIAQFAQDYRGICQHLALAKQRGYSYPLIEELQQLALQGHQQFYRHKNPALQQLIGFVVIGFPGTVRAQWRSVALAGALFFGSLIMMALLTGVFPNLIYSLMNASQVANMESMYDPANRIIGPMSLRDHQDDWVMFGFYIMNNIGIAFQTFASRLLFGLGSLFFLVFNGLHIGAVAGHLTRIGYHETFWPFVIGHGAFELTAIVLAGAAGLKLGAALVAPGRLSRAEALRQAASISIRLLGGAIIFLLIAAFIEAYWSSSSSLSITTKITVGCALWTLVLLYLTRSGRGRYAPQ